MVGYQSINAFQVSGSRYDIYTHMKDGCRAEVYFNPVTGAIVQNEIEWRCAVSLWTG